MKPENGENGGYMGEGTGLPPYLPYPKFLIRMELTQTAKLLYAVLLDRARLSQANDWIDENGRVYLVFPVERIAQALDKSPMTVKNALNELDAAGLLERKRQGFSAPNRLYVKLPPEVKISVPLTDKKLYPISKETCTYEGQKTVLMTDRKLSPNKLTNNNMNRNQINGVIGDTRAAYGKYQNIYLSEQEYAGLKQEYPDRLDRFIEEMSRYLAATGKTYQNYAAAMQMWADNDRKGTGKPGIPDYSFKEGESL